MARWAKSVLTLSLAATMAFAAALLPAQAQRAAAGDDVAQFIAEQTRDPIEGFNRGSFWFNHRLLYRIIEYPARGYRRITPHGFRQGVDNFATNLSGLRRIFNNLCQGEWGPAGTECERFLVNTTVGLLGIFDPATHWLDLNLYNEDFGQTVGRWGCGPGAHIEAPFLGPSDPRDLLAGVVDWAMDPLSYFPGASLAVRFNTFAMMIPQYQSALHSVNDPYMLFRDGFRLSREAQVRDVMASPAFPEPVFTDDDLFTSEDRAVAEGATVLENFSVDDPCLASLSALLLEPEDRNFYRRGRDRSVQLTSTGRTFDFRIWRHGDSAPLLFFIPGLGGHCTGSGATAFAELFFNEGFDVVVVPSSFHGDFSREASTFPLPGHTEVDARDTYTAMIDIFNSLVARGDCSESTPCLLVGESLGGLHALFISEMDRQSQSPRFRGFLALNPVVDLEHATQHLDHLFEASFIPRTAGDTAPLHESLLRASQFVQNQGDPPHGKPTPPLAPQDAAFGVGVYFRTQLADSIFDSQSRQDLGLLRTPLDRHHRAERHREIIAIGFEEYMRDFVGGQIGVQSLPALRARGGLQALLPGVAENAQVRAVHSANDFLLGPGDLTLLRQTFGDRLTLFNTGGHCGEYHLPQVQRAVREAARALME